MPATTLYIDYILNPNLFKKNIKKILILVHNFSLFRETLSIWLAETNFSVDSVSIYAIKMTLLSHSTIPKHIQNQKYYVSNIFIIERIRFVLNILEYRDGFKFRYIRSEFGIKQPGLLGLNF